MVIVSATCRRLLLPLPTSGVGIPDAIGEQPIQIGKVCIAVDEEVQAFAIVLARPLAIPRLPPRIRRGRSARSQNRLKRTMRQGGKARDSNPRTTALRSGAWTRKVGGPSYECHAI
jgi:hypothetical protein